MARTNAERREEWTQQQIARAEYYTACLFLGHPDGYDVRRAATQTDAEALARRMHREYGDNLHRRPAAVYAVTKGDHLSIHVVNVPWG